MAKEIPGLGHLLRLGAWTAKTFGMKALFGAAKLYVPGLTGALSYYDRRKRGDSLPNALAGAGVEAIGGATGEVIGGAVGVAGAVATGFTGAVAVPVGAAVGNVGGSHYTGKFYDWMMGNKELETSNQELKLSIDRLEQRMGESSGRESFGRMWTTGRNSSYSNFSEKSQQYLPRLMNDLNIGEEDAAAILGNLGHESAGLNPSIQERNPRKGIGGYGWAQWTGIRRRRFRQFAMNSNLDMSTDEANYQFLLHELTGTKSEVLAALKNAPTLESKMKIFESLYEKAGIKNYRSRMRYSNMALQGIARPPLDLEPKGSNSTTIVHAPMSISQPGAQKTAPMTPMTESSGAGASPHLEVPGELRQAVWGK